MKSLNLHEGKKIQTIIEEKTLRLTSLEQFLALRGTLSENTERETYENSSEQKWLFGIQHLTLFLLTLTTKDLI